MQCFCCLVQVLPRRNDELCREVLPSSSWAQAWGSRIQRDHALFHLTTYLVVFLVVPVIIVALAVFRVHVCDAVALQLLLVPRRRHTLDAGLVFDGLAVVVFVRVERTDADNGRPGAALANLDAVLGYLWTLDQQLLARGVRYGVVDLLRFAQANAASERRGLIIVRPQIHVNGMLRFGLAAIVHDADCLQGDGAGPWQDSPKLALDLQNAGSIHQHAYLGKCGI